MAKRNETMTATATMEMEAPNHDEEAFANISPIGQDPVVADLQSKRAALFERRALTVQRSEALQSKAGELHAENAIVRSADLLVSDPGAALTGTDRDTLHTELIETLHAIAVLDEAIRQNGRLLVQAESLASSVACRAVQRLHRLRARAVISAMLQLHYAYAAQQEVIARLNGLGHARTGWLTGFFVVDLGQLDDNGGWVACLLRDAREASLISEAERIAIMNGELRQLD